MNEKYKIKHTKKYVVTDILIEGRSIFELLDSQKINFSIDGFNALNDNVELPQIYENLFKDIFELAVKLEDKKKYILSANVVTFLFERFSAAWLLFLKNGQHFIAIKLWNKLLSFTLKWEEENKGKHLHKGTLFGFLSHTYLSMGDGFSAFNCLYKALNDDLLLGIKDKTSEYPKIAPSYLTITLNPSTANFMNHFVMEVRDFLKQFINQYNAITSKSFTIETLDNNFLQRRDLEPLNFFFTNTIWTIFEYRRRINPSLMKNDFALLKNPELFFSLCLIINDLLNNINTEKDKMGNAIEKYMKKNRWMIKDINIKGIISDGLPNQSIPDLLNLIHPHHKTQILIPEACLLIAWNIRNFSGHNIFKQDIFAKKFDEILAMLLFAILQLVENMIIPGKKG
jgi:hypothetical protein